MIRLTAVALASIIGLTTPAFAQTKDYDLSGFDRVDIATGLDAQITQGESFSVSAQSRSQDAIDNLQLSVKGGVLTARLEQSFVDFIISGGLVNHLLNGGNALEIKITLPSLSGVSASSGADVEVSGVTSAMLDLDVSSGADVTVVDAEIGNLVIDASSGSDVEIAGSANSLDAEASSGSDVDATNLIAETATAKATSGADISLHTTDRIEAEAFSGADIRIYGNPATRDVDESSGGDIIFED